MASVDRRAPALAALMVFVVCTGAAIAVSGARPANDPGTAPWVLQAIGYVCAAAAAVLLLAGEDDGRRRGALVGAVTVALVLLDLLVPDDGGADIGAGFVRLVLLLVLFVVTVGLAQAVARERRDGPAAPRA